MALPGDVTTFDLQFGAYTDAVGLAALVAAGGKLFAVDPSSNKKIRLTHITSGQVIVPDPVDVTIGEDGTGVVTGIPHTGQATISPAGYAWRVEWNIASNKPSPGNLTFVVPSGASADFDLLVPADTVPAVVISQPTVASVAGLTGAPTAQQVVDALDAPLTEAFGTVVTLEKFGAKGDGTTDDSAAVQAALNAIFDAGGGEITIGWGKTYRVDSQLTLPRETLTSPHTKQRYVRITGGGYSPSLNEPAPHGSILDLRYSGPDAKILALGQGVLELDHFTMADLGNSSTPFVLATQTVVRAHDMAVSGNPTKSGIACDQDVFILGGTTAAQTNTPDGGFQGYGSAIERVSFSHIRRAVYLRTWANGIPIRDNWIGHSCGTNLADGACFEIDGTVGFTRGNLLSGNTIEMQSYYYGVKLLGNAQHNLFFANSFWDGNVSGGIQVACYRFEAGATLCTVIGEPQNDAGGATFVSDANTSNPNWVIAKDVLGKMTFIHDQTFGGAVSVTKGLTTTGRMDQNDGAAATAVVSMVLARWGYGSGVGYWNVQNSGNPVTSRVVQGFNAAGTKTLQFDPGGFQGAVQVLSGTLRIAGGATGSRPSGQLAGAQWFDTTLNKPIWFNGSGWVDAAGTAV